MPSLDVRARDPTVPEFFKDRKRSHLDSIGPSAATCCPGECLLVKVKLACGPTEAKGRLCEGFQTPAVTSIPPPTRPASGNLQGTKAREGARMRPCHALSYGDLTAGAPQLRSAARVVER
jgi:hypothetical protein